MSHILTFSYIALVSVLLGELRKAQFRSELERIEQTMPDNGGAPAARDMEKSAPLIFIRLQVITH